jgi:hypothetical protein
MSEPPERPPQPGVETHVPKAAAAGVQAALDATFNAASGAGPEQVEQELRSQLEQHGVAREVSEDWVSEAVRVIASGEPVAAEPGDA